MDLKTGLALVAADEYIRRPSLDSRGVRRAKQAILILREVEHLGEKAEELRRALREVGAL